jgi:hypothetical protein
MKCQIENCNIERSDLSQHIRLDHKMNVYDYKKKFSLKYVVDEEKRKLRGQTRKITNQNTKQFKCDFCNSACLTEKALYQHYYDSNDLQHNYKINNNSNIDDWVECSLCGIRKSRIDFHLKISHNISIKEYIERFNKPFLSKNFVLRTTAVGHIKHESENFIGSKNPFFGKHHTEETKKRISETLFNKKDHCKAEEILAEQTEKFVNQEDSIEQIFKFAKKEI